MTDDTKTRTSDEAALAAETTELAKRYLDFWQRNLTSWSSDPDLFEKWAKQIINQPDSGQDKKTEPGSES
jgi:hypothetical protein